MSLSKKKVDVTFYDPKTMEPTCTFNQCHKKFKPSYEVVKKETPNLESGYFEHYQLFHQCEECGRKHIGRIDGIKTAKLCKEMKFACLNSGEDMESALEKQKLEVEKMER